MRVLEPFVLMPQIRVRIEVQDAEPWMLFRMRRDGPEGDAVISPDGPDDLPPRQPVRAGIVHPRVHLPRDRVHGGRVPRGRRRERRLRQHGDPRLVRLARLQIPEIDLPAPPQDPRPPPPPPPPAPGRRLAWDWPAPPPRRHPPS